MSWRHEYRTCHCGNSFQPKRENQRHCSRKCRVAVAVHKHRSDYTEASPTTLPEKRLQAPEPAMPAPAAPSERKVNLPAYNPYGPTPGALQGDDCPLEYDENGYPELPACLDRRPKPESEAKAA